MPAVSNLTSDCMAAFGKACYRSVFRLFSMIASTNFTPSLSQAEAVWSLHYAQEEDMSRTFG